MSLTICADDFSPKKKSSLFVKAANPIKKKNLKPLNYAFLPSLNAFSIGINWNALVNGNKKKRDDKNN